MRILRTIKLAVQNTQFRIWQRRHPGATFKDYFASIVRNDIQTRRIHPTLGENLRDGAFGEAGKATFKHLLSFGITPDDVCVDYGCGTLRVGVHAMRFLSPGRYWGLDIDQSLLDTGASLVGRELIREKQPKLRVISPDTVKEAAESKPAFLFSVAVLIHVHPAELDEYFRNILAIVNGSGTALVAGKWSDDKTYQLSRQSWAHSLPGMREMLDPLGARLSVVSENENRPAKHGYKGGIRGGVLELRKPRVG